MPIAKLARFGLIAVLIGISIFTYLREENAPAPNAGTEHLPERVTAAEPQSGATVSAKLPLGTGFDYYVLALSWSPSYCAAEGPNANRQQCDSAGLMVFSCMGFGRNMSKATRRIATARSLAMCHSPKPNNFPTSCPRRD